MKQQSPESASSLDFTKTPGGIPGLETMLPLLATYGVAAGRISWSRLVEVASANPARIFGLDRKGSLAPGKDADVVVYDPRDAGTIRAEKLHNLAGYTPYEGMAVQGGVRDVFSRGRALVRAATFIPAPGWGRYVKGGNASPCASSLRYVPRS
jgi:dihydropyrimidinase